MPTFYLDTSALLKRYKTEEGSPVIEQLFALLEKPANKAAISFLTVLEVIASGRRLLKGELISEDEFSELIREFLADVRRYFVLRGLDAKLFARAIDLALAHALRTADALQLATALNLKDVLERTGEKLIFIADDDDLCKAAVNEGLVTINPREKTAVKRLRQLASGR